MQKVNKKHCQKEKIVENSIEEVYKKSLQKTINSGSFDMRTREALNNHLKDTKKIVEDSIEEVNKKSLQKTINSGSCKMRKLEALNKHLKDEEKIYNLFYKLGAEKITKMILQEIIKEIMKQIQSETFLLDLCLV